MLKKRTIRTPQNGLEKYSKIKWSNSNFYNVFKTDNIFQAVDRSCVKGPNAICEQDCGYIKVTIMKLKLN